LIEESFGPVAEISIPIRGNSYNLWYTPLEGWRIEEMDGDVIRGDNTVTEREAYSVEHMIAVGLDNELGTGGGLRKELTHTGLSSRM
jgi:hypothetical protein